MKTLLIPSAALIPREMRSRMGAIPACLFPLNGDTMLEHICQQYHDVVDTVYVLVNREKQQVYNYIALKKLNVKIVEVDELRDLGYTILCGLKAIQNENVELLYINFADTLIANQLINEPRNAVYYNKQTMDEDWSFFHQENGCITQIFDKQVVKEEGHSIESDVFVGTFELSHPRQLLEELETALKEERKEDSFYLALQRYSNRFAMEFILANRWFDVGHSDRYAQAKTGVEARAFNSIDIDENRGILKKQSKNQDKLIDEIQWYLKMPAKLQYLTPRIYEYSLERNAPYVSMEYYGYNTLHEIFVFGDISTSQWRKYFEKILFAIKDMGKYRVKCEPENIRSSLEAMYISKTVERLGSLRDDSHFSAFFCQDIQVNDLFFPNLERCIELLPKLVYERLIDSAGAEFCIIHGDLYFANILAEDRFGFLRLVDPRGRFGEFDIYGDQRYELAKLMHSLDGGFDFIIEDLFSVQVENTHIVLEMPRKIEAIYDEFKKVFKELLTDYKDLQLIESLLFLSMIPLHSDSLSRQYAMLATGLRLLAEATGGAING